MTRALTVGETAELQELMRIAGADLAVLFGGRGQALPMLRL
ncbi:hypothetical protein [Phyllobacterium chamaecytisi]|nr:hypothetical protein [Phyllobacterium sp. KW56]